MTGTLTIGLEVVPEARVGDTVTVLVTGVVSGIDGDLIDCTGFSKAPEYLTGSPTVTLVTTDAKVVPA